MSEAYERERQNNARLDELASKVTALRGVTIDIFDDAREHGVIDSTVRLFPSQKAQNDGSDTDVHTVRNIQLHDYILEGLG